MSFYRVKLETSQRSFNSLNSLNSLKSVLVSLLCDGRLTLNRTLLCEL